MITYLRITYTDNRLMDYQLIVTHKKKLMTMENELFAITFCNLSTSFEKTKCKKKLKKMLDTFHT